MRFSKLAFLFIFAVFSNYSFSQEVRYGTVFYCTPTETNVRCKNSIDIYMQYPSYARYAPMFLVLTGETNPQTGLPFTGNNVVWGTWNNGSVCPAHVPSGVFPNCEPDNTICPTGQIGYLPDCVSIASGAASNLGGNCPNNTSNPINIPTGNKFFQVNDYRDDNFSFSRFYNSLTGGWRFSYRQKLTVHPDFITAERADGKGIFFTKVSGNFNTKSQRRESLSFDGTVYSLRFTNNTIETYDATGRLLSIDSPYEERISLNHVNDQVIVSKGNNQLVLTVGNDKEITKADFPNATHINYTYQITSNRPLLASLLYSTGASNVFFYEDTRFPTYITGIEDENSIRISSVQYDDQGRAISSEKGPLNSGVERTQIQYNADGTRTLTNALGKQSTYHFTQFNGEYKMTQVEGHPSTNCAGANKNYTYDTNGFMESKTDWKGNITTYIHNDRGQELSRVEASGTPHAHTITTEWHAEFNLPIKIIESARETIMAYDANGRLLSRQVQARSN
jgi:hypothetical protein